MKMRFAPLALAALVAAMPLATLAQSAPAPAAPPTAAEAAPHHHRHHRGHHGHMMKMLQSLNLTADQKTKIDGYVAAMKSANAATTDKATRHANMQTLRTQITGVLTPDQQAQLKAKMQAERKAEPAEKTETTPQ